VSKDEPNDITIKIPRQLRYDVKKYIEKSKGKRYLNDTDFYREAIRRLLDHYESKVFMKYLGLDEFGNVIINDVVLPKLVSLRISKNNGASILICNTCLDDCKHRDFVLKHEPLWNHLKENNVKIKRVRDHD